MAWSKLKDKEPPNQDDEYFVKNGGDKYLLFWDNEEKEFYQIEQSCKMTYFEKEQFPNIEWWDVEELNQNILWAEVGVIFETGLRIDAPKETADLLQSKYTLSRK